MAAWLTRLNDLLPLRYAAWLSCGVGLAVSLLAGAGSSLAQLAALIG